MYKQQRILFLTLYTFSLTGGIEKVCRSVIKMLSDVVVELCYHVDALSLYDHEKVDKYTPHVHFEYVKGNKIRFLWKALKAGSKADTIILSHINLLIFGLIIKKMRPKARIILFAHGIEIWKKLSSWKRAFLSTNVEIWAVSTYTAMMIREKHGIDRARIHILNNGLDPFLQPVPAFEKPDHLIQKHHISGNHRILFTLARLSSSEQYKGYDIVLEAMRSLPSNVVYLLSGQADEAEKKRILKLIDDYQLNDRVKLTGFLPDDQLSDYYLLADIFVMPSLGEGFGITFIEAAAHGCPSIAGNLDGSRDALLNGRLGSLVDPKNVKEVTSAIRTQLEKGRLSKHSLSLQQECLKHFSYQQHKLNFIHLL